MTDNADQIAYWNGQTGRKWAEDQVQMDRMMQAMTDAVVAAAAPQAGESAIDVGCGAGASALAVADLVGPAGSVLAVDVSRPLLEAARQRAAGRPNIRFVEADASSYHFAPAGADLLVSKFGVMFFADPTKAFRNLRQAVKSGGRLAFICWRALAENPFATVPMGAALRHLPPQAAPDPTAPGPFAFADPVRVGHILTEAGFQTPAFAAFDNTMIVGRSPVRAATEAVLMGMASRLLMNASQEVKQAVIEELTAEYEKHMSPDGVSFPARCWVVTASA
jgi:SAM-dependent methyltransferase